MHHIASWYLDRDLLKDMPPTPDAQSLRLVMTVCELFLCSLYVFSFYIGFSTLLLPQCAPMPNSPNAVRWDCTGGQILSVARSRAADMRLT